MLERLPYFRCAPADYLLDTLGLTQREHGAYWLIMLHYYWNGSLPENRAELYAMACATDADGRAAVDTIIGRFFKDENGKITHSRIERELGKLNDFFRKQSIKGIASGVARGKKKTGSTARVNGSHAFTPPDWIIVRNWDAWVKIRPAKARTNDALSAAVEKLEGFRAQGHDPNAIIAESLANGWQGLFAPDRKRGAGKTVADHNRASAEEAVRRMEQEHGQE